MRRLWYTAWPFLALGCTIGLLCFVPGERLLIVGDIVTALVLLCIIVTLLAERWDSYKETK